MRYPAILLLFSFVLSCGTGSENQRRDLSNNFKIAINLYSSPIWTDRVNSVRMINSFLYNADKSKNIPIKTRSAYEQISEDFLLESSRDIQAAVRIESTAGLAMMKTKNSYNRLLDMSAGDPEINVRWYSLRALGQYRYSESGPVFSSGLKSEDWLIREASIIGLLEIADTDVKKKYIREITSALNDVNQAVRVAALEGLDFNNDAFYPVIASHLKKKEITIQIVKSSLKALKGYSLEADLRGKIISEFLTHSDPEIRVLAYKVLTSEIKPPSTK